MHLRLSILESRVVCGGIPVMSMVSVVASNGHTVRTYAADGIFLVQKTVHLSAQVLWRDLSKILHDRQKKQCTFSLNKICSHLILVLLVFFPLSNFLNWTVLFSSCHHFDMKNIKVRRAHCKLFFKIGKPLTALPNTDLQIHRIWFFYFS